MKPFPLIVAFAAGFVLATVIGLAVVMPASRQAWQVNVDSDVHRPLEGALQYIEQAAAAEDCEETAARLRLLNKRFAEYRAGGPTPADWWADVVAATRPAHYPAGPGARGQ